MQLDVLTLSVFVCCCFMIAQFFSKLCVYNKSKIKNAPITHLKLNNRKKSTYEHR